LNSAAGRRRKQTARHVPSELPGFLLKAFLLLLLLGGLLWAGWYAPWSARSAAVKVEWLDTSAAQS
jgi:hypothetical protein